MIVCNFQKWSKAINKEPEACKTCHLQEDVPAECPLNNENYRLFTCDHCGSCFSGEI